MIAGKIWTTRTWAVYEGSQLCGLFDQFRCGEQPHGGEAGPPVAWHGTRLTLHDGSMKSGSTTEEYDGTHRGKVGRRRK